MWYIESFFTMLANQEQCLLKHKPCNPRCGLFALIIAIFVVFVDVKAATAAATHAILFYNPETNINNYAFLKSEFDSYLARRSNFRFQAFSKRATFEQILTNKPQGIFFLSSWHYRQLSKKLPITPVLVGITKGKSTQHKLLMANSNSTLNTLHGATVACAGTDHYTKILLREMLGQHHADLVNSLNILTVPKDIDALMAVGFGVAKIALTTKHSLKQLVTINPKQYRLLKQLGKRHESMLLIVAINQQPSQADKQLLSIVEAMEHDSSGKKQLKLLGLDGWKKLNDAELMDLRNE